MTTEMSDLQTRFGRVTDMDPMPIPLLAVPYAAPKLAKTNAEATPIQPKNVYATGSLLQQKGFNISVQAKVATYDAIIDIFIINKS